MSATFIWSITAMAVKPTEGNYTDVVIDASWLCTATEPSGEQTYTAIVAGSCAFPMPEGQFTPYADLTQNQVLGWVWANGVDKTATEAAVQQQIDNQINPPVIQPPLPWAA